MLGQVPDERGEGPAARTLLSQLPSLEMVFTIDARPITKTVIRVITDRRHAHYALSEFLAAAEHVALGAGTSCRPVLLARVADPEIPQRLGQTPYASTSGSALVSWGRRQSGRFCQRADARYETGLRRWSTA